MLEVTVKDSMLAFGKSFTLEFQRTLRIPDDGKIYSLPPGLGAFPVLRVDDYAKQVPKRWLERGGVFIPMYQREAMWINLRGRHWKPNAIKIAASKVNAVSGRAWSQELRADIEDYLVSPPQPWLDGINAGEGSIRQFVAMPLGMGYTVEAQVTGEEIFGGVQIIVYEPKPGRFPDEPPARDVSSSIETGDIGDLLSALDDEGGAEMGLAAGGKMKQKIYSDPHGIETWDLENFGRVYVHIVNSMMFREITGREPPATPVSAKTYAASGLPWFDLYDEGVANIPASQALQAVKSVKEIDHDKGFQAQQDDATVPVANSDVLKLGPKPVKDGKW